MLKFLFTKSRRGSADGQVPSASAPGSAQPRPARSAGKAMGAPAGTLPTPPEVPLATRLAELAALADGDPGLLELALANGPAEVRMSALARLSDPAALARVAADARSADTRHAAVLRVDDEALLEQIAQQTRSRDKRVYKTARERLDGYARERERLALQARWLETVEALAAQAQPELSRVVEVERVWAALHPDAEAEERFAQARARLHARFQTQAEERRLARQAQPGGSGAEPGAPPAPAEPHEAAEPDATTPSVTAVAGAEPPADLAPGATAAVDPRAAMSQASPESVSAHPMPATAPPMDTQSPVDDPTAVPGLPANDATSPLSTADRPVPMGTPADAEHSAEAGPAQGRRASRPGSVPGDGRQGARRGAPAPDLREDIARELAALEAALEEGHLHDAEQRLEALSALQSRSGGVEGKLGGRIRRAVDEISRLRAWRRWGGLQARDHLCDAAEGLQARELPLEELGRAVKALRAQWQAIAVSEGGAPHHLWERFDTACEKAWAPVREHFARQAERRQENLGRREALVAELEARVAELDAPPVDWKAVSALLADAGRRWRTLGPVDRKLSKPLEARYAAALSALDARLQSVRNAEAAEREALIRRAEQLNARTDNRDTVTRLRELQAEWQTRARSVSLDRVREQALWERFRTACDTVFQARDAARAADEAERSAQATLEADLHRKHSEAWRGLREAALVCAAAEAALCALPAVGSDASAIGQALADRAAELEASWRRLPALSGKSGAVLQARRLAIEAACADATAWTAFVQQVERAQTALAAAVLELELALALGLPSPDELQAARRSLQLQRLADALRSGGRGDREADRDAALAALAWPAATLPPAQRLDTVLAQLAPRPPERRVPPERRAGSERPREAAGTRPAGRSRDGGRDRPGAAAKRAAAPPRAGH